LGAHATAARARIASPVTVTRCRSAHGTIGEDRVAPDLERPQEQPRDRDAERDREQHRESRELAQDRAPRRAAPAARDDVQRLPRAFLFCVAG
jgi:hypothetical protein